MKTFSDVYDATGKHPQNFFSREKMRAIRARMIGGPVPLTDGGCLLIMTSNSTAAPKGTPHSRDIAILRVYPGGMVGQVLDTVLKDTDHAQKMIKTLQHKLNTGSHP